MGIISKKEYDLMMEYFQKQGEEVARSKTAAKKLLIRVGFLTTRGTFRKNRRPARKVKP
jgi:hypothetical protein